MALLKLYCLLEHRVQRTKGGVSTVSYHCYSLKITEFTTSSSQTLQKAVSWLWKRKPWLVKGTARQNPAGGSHEREGYQVREGWFLKENLPRAQGNTSSHCTGDEEIQQKVCSLKQEASYSTRYAK